MTIERPATLLPQCFIAPGTVLAIAGGVVGKALAWPLARARKQAS